MPLMFYLCRTKGNISLHFIWLHLHSPHPPVITYVHHMEAWVHWEHLTAVSHCSQCFMLFLVVFFLYLHLIQYFFAPPSCGISVQVLNICGRPTVAVYYNLSMYKVEINLKSNVDSDMWTLVFCCRTGKRFQRIQITFILILMLI